MESTSSRYLITLVHGTWGRGFFPRAADPSAPRWFEKDSGFRRELEEALAKDSVDYQIAEFHWSGRNSVRARDVAAGELAKHIIGHAHLKNHLVIAHSHGGNVATRSLAHLVGSEVSLEIVSLSTPFIKLYESAGIETRFDGYSRLVSLLAIGFALLFWYVCTTYAADLDSRKAISELYVWGTSLASIPVGLGVGFLLSAPLYSYFDPFGYLAVDSHEGYKPQRSTLLVEASRYPTYSKNLKRFLVIRGIDDEATLALAFGALLSWLSGSLFQVLGRTAPPIILLGKLLLFLAAFFPGWSNTVVEYLPKLGLTMQPAIYAYLAVVGAMFGLSVLICLGKGTFGVELLRGSVRIDIESGNAPNLAGDLSIITLRPDLSLKTRGRHFIYNNEGCILAIVSWLVDRRVAVTFMYDPRTRGGPERYPSLKYDR